MPFTADLFVDRPTRIHALDPRVKLLFVASALVLFLRFRSVLVLLAGALLLLLLHAAARTPARRLASLGKALLPTNLLIASLWILFYPSGEAFFEFWRIRMTWLSVAQGLALALRIDAMALAVFLWLYTTDQRSLVRGFVKLGLPYEWGLTLALALRYIPSFQGSYAQIADAQQARGLNINEGSAYRRVRVLMPIFVAMVISALRSSEHLARALEARAFGARGVRRTYLYDLALRREDYVVAAFLLAVFAALLAFNLITGFGAQPVQLR